MAVVYKVATTIGAVAANPPTFNLTLPTFASGNLAVDDIIVIHVLSKNLTLPANEINTPSGYTEKGTKTSVNGSVAADQGRGAMFYKRAVAGDDGASVTISRAGTSTLGLYAIAYVFRGALTSGDPFDTAGIVILGDTTADSDIDWSAFDAIATSLHTIYFGWQFDDNTSTPTDLVNGGSTFTFRNEQETATGSDATALLWSADHGGANLAAVQKALTTTAGASLGYVYGLLPAPADTPSNAEPGSYGVMGALAGTLRGLLLAAELGAYALTGADASTARGFAMNAEPGAYVVAGADAATAGAFFVSADPGSYTIAGTAATTVKDISSVADPGSYGLTGAAAEASRDVPIDAQSGAYAVNGAAAATLQAHLVVADAGGYTVTGADATTGYAGGSGIELNAEPGSYLLAGAVASTLQGYVEMAAAGSYALIGAPATTDRTISLPLWLEDLSVPRYLVLDRSTGRYSLMDRSRTKLLELDTNQVRYLLEDRSRPTFLFVGSPNDGSGTWSFTGETWDSAHWHWDGSWS